MKLTVGKYDDSILKPIAEIFISDDYHISFETEDEYLKDFLIRRFEKGIKVTKCRKGKDGSIGQRDIYIKPSDPDFVSALQFNLPKDYTIIERMKSAQAQHRKTA